MCESDAYRLGWQTFFGGGQIGDNPYPYGSAGRDAWKQGFLDAEDADADTID